VRGVQQIKLPLQVKVEKSLHGAVRPTMLDGTAAFSACFCHFKPVLVGRVLGAPVGNGNFFLDLVGSFRLGASVSYRDLVRRERFQLLTVFLIDPHRQADAVEIQLYALVGIVPKTQPSLPDTCCNGDFFGNFCL